ncbi:MAG: hypothetical protein B7Y45_05845 [Sphingomonas sp. 28-66-16]|nr:MAG: hypothetical protein B7Y45_05845 [Sphingomonas sp. 28-66-16]
MTRNILASIGLLTIIFSGAFAAYAHDDWGVEERPRRLAVSFAGLDLSAPEGRAMLDRRLRIAIGRVCGRADARELWRRAAIERCHRAAWDATRPQVQLAVTLANRRRDYADQRIAATDGAIASTR